MYIFVRQFIGEGSKPCIYIDKDQMANFYFIQKILSLFT